MNVQNSDGKALRMNSMDLWKTNNKNKQQECKYIAVGEPQSVVPNNSTDVRR